MKQKSHSLYMDTGKRSEKKEKIEIAAIPLFLRGELALLTRSEMMYRIYGAKASIILM